MAVWSVGRAEGGTALAHPPSNTIASTDIGMRTFTHMGRDHRAVGSVGGACGCEAKAKLALGDDSNISDLDEGSTEPFSEDE